MTQRSRLRRRVFVLLATAGATLLALSAPAAARGTGQHDVTRVDDAKAAVAASIELKTTGPAEATTGVLTIAPGGHTAWHHHPGPHLVKVKAGTLRVYETDCTFKTYTAGQGFYDPGRTDHPHIHTGYNAETTGKVEFAVTDIREADKRLTIATEPQPASCFAAAAVTSPAPASDATGSANLPRTGAAPTGLLATLGLSLIGAGAVNRAFGRRRH